MVGTHRWITYKGTTETPASSDHTCILIILKMYDDNSDLNILYSKFHQTLWNIKRILVINIVKSPGIQSTSKSCNLNENRIYKISDIIRLILLR